MFLYKVAYGTKCKFSFFSWYFSCNSQNNFAHLTLHTNSFKTLLKLYAEILCVCRQKVV